MDTNFYIIRHAIAEERSLEKNDSERVLTDKGRERFLRHVRSLEKLDIQFDQVFTSPWIRAVQTAEMLALISTSTAQPVRELSAAPNPALLRILAHASGPDAKIAAVGHEPWLSELAAWLITGSPTGGDNLFRIKKGSVLHLRGAVTPGGMQLMALLPPRFLRATAVQ